MRIWLHLCRRWTKDSVHLSMELAHIMGRYSGNICEPDCAVVVRAIVFGGVGLCLCLHS